MKYAVVTLCLLLLATNLFAQRKQRELKAIGEIKFDERSALKHSKQLENTYGKLQKSTSISWNLVDSTGNSLSAFYQAKQVAYDPGMNILLYTHRGNADYEAVGGSGGLPELWGNVSTNSGTTWRRYSGPYNAGDGEILGRYPGGAIFNPNFANDTNTALAFIDCINRFTQGTTPVTGDLFLGKNSLTKTGVLDDLPTGGRVAHNDAARVYYDFHVGSQWSTKTNMFSANVLRKDGGSGSNWRGIGVFKTPDLNTLPPVNIPAQMESSKISLMGIMLPGDAVEIPPGSGNFKMAVGVVARFFREFHPLSSDSNIVSPFTIGVSYSTNEGTNWTALDTVNLPSVPGLKQYQIVNFWDGFYNTSGNGMVLDSLGYPHIALALEDTLTGNSVVLAEVYKDAGGWKGKLIDNLNISGTDYSWGDPANTANFADDFSGPNPVMVRNKTGSVIACTYLQAQSPYHRPDIFVSSRKISSDVWKAPVNASNSPGINETFAYSAHYMRSDGGNNYTIFESIAFPRDTANFGIESDLYEGEIHVDATPAQHDLAAFSINGPPEDGYNITTDSTISGFKATVKNVGEQAQTTSFQVRYRILDSLGTQLFTNTVTIASLGIGKDTVVSFSGSFHPSSIGKYTARARVITSPQDEAISNDSTSLTINVVNIPSWITAFHTDKFHRTYTEIPDTGGLPAADDLSMYAPMPFFFTYNGHAYDSVHFSTNGWVQLFDTGSVFGKSSRESGVGARNHNYLPSTALNHSFSAWWDDMNSKADGSGDTGTVTYTTLGSAPNRVFVIQWKNISSTFDNIEASTRLNFQVRLYETSNILEFCYGPKTNGQFVNGGETQGGAIGLKDSSGGDYHFFDAYQEGNGNHFYLKIDINPNNNWPGQNAVWRFYRTTAVKVALQPRWNLISTPAGGDNLAVSQIFPTALSNTTYLYKNGYQLVGVLNEGRGYWTKFGTSQGSFPTTGKLPIVDDSVTTGWNLIGAPDHSVPAPSGGIVNGPVYEYSTGYHIVTTLQPGKGYWAKTSATGILTLGTGASATSKAAPENLDIYNSVTIKDKTGAAQTLYFRENTDEGIALENYEMPPVPPQGVFDVRFSSGRMLEAYPQVVKDAVEYGLNAHSLEYPVVVSWNIRNGNGKGFAIVEKENEKVLATHTMSGAGNFTLAKAAPGLGLKVSVGKLVPKEFALGQNYPNPFNPTTKFSVEVPKTAVVDVSVFDILGRKVTTLFNGEKEAGYYTVEWNGLNAENESVASGVFFIRMTSGKFDAVRKVMLMK